ISSLRLKLIEKITGTTSFCRSEGAKRLTQPPLIVRESEEMPFSLEKIERIINDCDTLLFSVASSDSALPGPLSIASGCDTILLKRDTILIHGDGSIQNSSLSDKFIAATGHLSISDNSVLNKCMFLGKTITVDNALMKECVLFSQGIQRLLSPVQGTQCIATDSILVSSQTDRSHGNLWICRLKQVQDTLVGGIFFQEQGFYNGHAICFSDSSLIRQPRTATVVLGYSSTFSGTIITNGDLSMKNCGIKGHLWARSIQAIDNGIGYVNWLIGCTILPDNQMMPFPMFGENPVRVLYMENKDE
ncbi:MAG: hypothetical protein JW795_06895, partial [Chitinivibrionales bacterium]|nr:hypothetical protein [Chitinivibrionales bacterium]